MFCTGEGGFSVASAGQGERRRDRCRVTRVICTDGKQFALL
jgi:hypothetical protein